MVWYYSYDRLPHWSCICPFKYFRCTFEWKLLIGLRRADWQNPGKVDWTPAISRSLRDFATRTTKFDCNRAVYGDNFVFDFDDFSDFEEYSSDNEEKLDEVDDEEVESEDELPFCTCGLANTNQNDCLWSFQCFRRNSTYKLVCSISKWINTLKNNIDACASLSINQVSSINLYLPYIP